ncbi:uncharacterized protein EI90DRAFT_3011643 [Cantharellus anzutake]|uniref:uncharacterized protein n=1 Tax=Cantharellus anzutake TaxID=1750568 RepID=UPI001908133B|nr:uncharacterized protein EI90DRAFT_3011643 [Cantharellus anzutake]KAF8342093.1 hypothetical protein EI90DRAFT_3011643 [Cantharellus anzutake]
MDNQTSMYAFGGLPQQTPCIRRRLNPGTSLGQPPKRKLETASDTPQKLRSPRSPLSDLNNPSCPAIESRAFSDNSRKINPPLSRMAPEVTGVSGSKQVSSGLPLIDLSDRGVNTFCPSTPTYVLACKTCGSTQQHFLKGNTKQGTQPVDIVRLIVEHNFGRDKEKRDRPTYHPLPSFTSHPHPGGLLVSANPIQVLSFYEHQDFAARVLKGEHTALTWAKVTGFSFTGIQEIVREKALLLWSILTMAAIGPNVSHLAKAREDAIEGARGRGSNNVRDPWLGCTVSILVLAYFHCVKVNMMQTVLGNVLFTTNAHWSLHSTFGHMGLVTSYSNTLERLHSLGQEKKATLKALGCMLVAGEIQIHLLYDNINQYHRAWRANLTSQNRLESGTAVTLIVQHKIDGHKNVFNGPEYECRKLESSKEPITFKADVNPLHLEDVAITNILWIFLKFIPHLQKFKNDVDNLQYVKHAKCCMKLQKTEYHLLECSGYNEASTQGNRDVVLDAFIRQLGLSCDELEGRQFLVSGDQATVARLRTLLEQTSLCRSWFTTHKWVLPVIELWHLKWAFLKGIFKAHWACKVGKGDVGLRTAAEALGWNINPDKVEFYPCYRLAELVLTTMTLHYARCFLHEKATTPLVVSGGINRLHLIEELQEYCKPDLTHNIYTTYGTTEATTFAQHHDSTVGGAFFNSYEINPSHDCNPMGNTAPVAGNDPPPLDERSWGDTLLYNNIVLYRDLLHLYELNTSVHDGDIGRTFEVIHQNLMLQWLRFYFFGVGSNNYGNELLQQARDFWWHLPTAT